VAEFSLDKICVAVCAALLMGSAPAFAADLGDGFVDPEPVAIAPAPTPSESSGEGISFDATLYYGALAVSSNYDSSYDFSNGNVSGGGMRAAFPLGDRFFVQLDYNFENVVDGDSDSASSGDYAYLNSNFAGHLGMDTDYGRYGVMYSVGKNEDFYFAPTTTIAVEGMRTYGNTTVLGQLGFSFANDGVEELRGGYGHIGVLTAVSDRLSLGGNIGIGRYDYEAQTSDPDGPNIVTIGLEAFYHLNDTVSFYASYQGSTVEEPAESEDWGSSTLFAGIRMNFGGSPTFADYNPLTGVAHARFTDWD